MFAVSVTITKRVKSEKVTAIALDLPVKVATAHSLRFGDQTRAIQALEEVMQVIALTMDIKYHKEMDMYILCRIKIELHFTLGLQII